MATYRVCFDGRWQGRFSDRDQAVDWARQVGDTGRIVHVAESRFLLLPLKLIAIFPEDEEDEGRRLWKVRRTAAGGGGGGGWGA